MALGTCRECKKPVSSEAAACPHCGAAKPYDAAKEQQQKTIQGVASLIGIVFVLFIVFKVVGSGGTPAPAPTPKTPAEASAQHEADVKALAAFHVQLFKIDHEIEAASKIEQAAWTKGAKTMDTMLLYTAAKTYRSVLEDADAQLMNLPTISLSNSTADEQATAAKTALTFRVTILQEVADLQAAVADIGNAKPSDVENLTHQIARANSQALEEAIAISKAYEALGIDLSEVDTTNGGLVPAKEKPKPTKAAVK